MKCLTHRPCSGTFRGSYQSAVSARRTCSATVSRTQLAPCNAQRQEIERVDFGDVYMAMQERVATQGTLPKVDGRLMVESIRSIEHAQRTLQLIARHVAAKREMAGALELDWPVRKKWLARICEIALRMPNAKPIILDIFANAEVFGLSTYFAAEMVELLAEKGAEEALLMRVVDLFRLRRPAGDKGVAAAYHRLLDVMKKRKNEAATQAASAALQKYLAAPTAAAAVTVTAVAAVAPAPVPTVPVAAPEVVPSL